MTEAQVGFLYNIAAAISKSKNDNLNVLKSYYLIYSFDIDSDTKIFRMKCKEITRGYGLPDKYFSSDLRCPKCCIQWKRNTEIKVRSINLSKRQRKRLKSKKTTKNKRTLVPHRKGLLNSNEIEQNCMFCKKKTITTVLKPRKHLRESTVNLNDTEIPTKVSNANQQQNNITNIKKVNMKKETHVYANALNIFSMENKNNILASTIKEKPKTIKNNKKKKDKFAGLCQKAVLAAAKIKEENIKQNSLNLFLKPSV